MGILKGVRNDVLTLLSLWLRLQWTGRRLSVKRSYISTMLPSPLASRHPAQVEIVEVSPAKIRFCQENTETTCDTPLP